jgi:hypothetical protein
VTCRRGRSRWTKWALQSASKYNSTFLAACLSSTHLPAFVCQEISHHVCQDMLNVCSGLCTLRGHPLNRAKRVRRVFQPRLVHCNSSTAWQNNEACRAGFRLRPQLHPNLQTQPKRQSASAVSLRQPSHYPRISASYLPRKKHQMSRKDLERRLVRRRRSLRKRMPAPKSRMQRQHSKHTRRSLTRLTKSRRAG